MVPEPTFQIFLASPGDLSKERDLVRSCVAIHNRSIQGSLQRSFKVVGWEQTRGTVRRPQEQINELIAESHFLIALFGQKWGSTPGSPWGYSSGTEEELFTGLLEMARSDRPMKDIWVGFIKTAECDESITALKGQITEKSALLFESLSGGQDLKDKLTDRLGTWSLETARKTPRQIDLVPSSGRDVLRAFKLRNNGQMLVAMGQSQHARQQLAEAASIGGPLDILAFAQFLRREGKLEAAQQQVDNAIDQVVKSYALDSLEAVAVFRESAKIQAINRNFDAAAEALKRVLSGLSLESEEFKNARCAVEDDLGRVYHQQEKFDRARSCFKRALQVRESLGRTVDACQSRINLARLEVASGDIDAALEQAQLAMQVLETASAPDLRANCELLMAQVWLRKGHPDQGLGHASSALNLNRHASNRRGEAISLLLLAQLHRANHDNKSCRQYAEECLQLNREMGDSYGADRARWLINNPDSPR